jgi:hypothetical protein
MICTPQQTLLKRTNQRGRDMWGMQSIREIRELYTGVDGKT